MEVEKIVTGFLETNCYLVYDEGSKEAIIVDPGGDAPKIKKTIGRLKLQPKFIVSTHGHIDHIGANGEFDLPLYIHKLDKDFLTDSSKNLSGIFGMFACFDNKLHFLEEGDSINLGGDKLIILHTPGHTPGSISLKGKGFVITGDALFKNGIGRTDLPQASEKTLIDSIVRKLLVLPDDTVVYPGHGEDSTIGEEKVSNPFLN